MHFDLLTSSAPFFAENGFWFAIRESSWPGIVVCVVLAVLSCFSWAVMVSKMKVVTRAYKKDRQFLNRYRDERDPLMLYEKGELVQGSPAAGIYHAGARELAFHLVGSSETDENFRARIGDAEPLRPSQLDGVSNAMDRAVSGAAGGLESQMSVLATAVSGAPFLGLLGTVWGVMDTFSGVASSAGVASLKTMAPGVSAALVTTVVALLVAIPAMFGYNYLVNRIRSMIMGLDNFAAELRLDIERWYVDHAIEKRLPQPVQVEAVGEAPAPIKKKERLQVKELVATAAAEQPDVPEFLEEAEEGVEPEIPLNARPFHRITKREDPVLVDGEFDLGGGTES
ncbi:MAG: MotA/TolQ/ExbB proton channel family protein [Verrucomicrobiales bacterium]